MNKKILEAIADIAYFAGAKNYSSGDSRLDASEFILWAEQFESLNSDANWDQRDYILEIEDFANAKIQEASQI